MDPTRAIRFAMPVAAAMIAHQVAAKAVRDATFLAAWPVSYVPAIVMATAVVVVALVPIYSRLFERFGPWLVVPAGFGLSAIGHLVEWQISGSSRWVAVAIYLHIAGLSGMLLSGFWSVLSEVVDPRTARATYGRIAAAGTLGGLVGGLLIAEGATRLPAGSELLLLAVLHLGCAVGVLALGGTAAPAPAVAPRAAARPLPRAGLFSPAALRSVPHLKTMALIVLLGTAAAAIADYLLKVQAVQRIDTEASLLRFFAMFYVCVQVAIFLSQFGVSAVIRRFGIGRTISSLPAGTAGMGVLALLFPAFPMLMGLRGAEAVLRGSLFRSAYELIFVPMDPAEKRRTKTFLDVTCDRAGDAVGAGIVQLMMLTGAAYLTSELLAVVIALSMAGVWLGTRMDALYLRVVERRLAAHDDAPPLVVNSETGWTVLEFSHLSRVERASLVSAPLASVAPSIVDPALLRLGELASGDRTRVERALDQLTQPTALDIAQIVQLLAWNDLVPRARRVLELAVPAHVGLLTDALLDPDTDFAIRRRIPRVLGTAADPRAVAGLLAALDDARFEVRYQCSRAIQRIIAKHPELRIDAARLLAVAAREVSVAPHVWHGYRLIDNLEREEEGDGALVADQGARNLEHVFSLLAAVLPVGPLDVARRGIRSDDASLRGVAVEYLESVLPPQLWVNLSRLLEATPTGSAVGARGQSDPPPRATPR